MAGFRIKHSDNPTCVVCGQGVNVYGSIHNKPGVNYHVTKRKGCDPVYIHTRCLRTQGDVAHEEDNNNEKET